MNFLFTLDDAEQWALGYDSRQWMIMRAKNRRGEIEWQPVSFIASEKSVLRLITMEKGIMISAEASNKLADMPERFKDWIAEHEALQVAA